MGWVYCTANTAYDWVFSNLLNNIHVTAHADYSQLEHIEHSGALLIGTYDTFAGGDPKKFLININKHLKTRDENKLIFIEETGHTYQLKQDELAQKILNVILSWRKN